MVAFGSFQFFGHLREDNGNNKNIYPKETNKINLDIVLIILLILANKLQLQYTKQKLLDFRETYNCPKTVVLSLQNDLRKVTEVLENLFILDKSRQPLDTLPEKNG